MVIMIDINIVDCGDTSSDIFCLHGEAYILWKVFPFYILVLFVYHNHDIAIDQRLNIYTTHLHKK